MGHGRDTCLGGELLPGLEALWVVTKLSSDLGGIVDTTSLRSRCRGLSDHDAADWAITMGGMRSLDGSGEVKFPLLYMTMIAAIIVF